MSHDRICESDQVLYAIRVVSTVPTSEGGETYWYPEHRDNS